MAFIHGLGGDCLKTWGRKGQPGTFLQRLAADLPAAAIATFGYPTGLKRKLKVRELAKIWAHEIRERFLFRYRSVAIICHSLGGVVTQAALRHLLTTEPGIEARLRERELQLSVFFMGVPQHGTKTHGAGWLSNELEVLTYNEDLVRENTEFWQSRVRQPDEALTTGKVPIAAYAVVSEQDQWVPQLSAGDHLAEGQILRVALSHPAMVKPPVEGDFRPYDFVLDRLQRRLEAPGLPRQVRQRLEDFEQGLKMIFDRVRIDHVVPRPWLDARLDAALEGRTKGGYVHLEAQAGAGKTAYMARLLRERDLPGFFFDASQGIVGPSELHEALWAQLVARGLLPGGEPPEGLGSDSRVLRRLLEEAGRRSEEPLLFVVDALDEAETVQGSPAHLPRLPAGIVGITSARPGTPAPPGAVPIPIDVEGADSAADVRRFVEARAAEGDLAAVLANHDWSAKRLVHEVSERAGGQFAFAHYVLTDLAERNLTPAELEELGPGLTNYYAFTWRRWQEADPERFRSLLRPTLAAVAVARAPVTPGIVATWAEVDSADAEEVLRHDLRPWVTAARRSSSTAYRLYHQSVQTFLAAEIEAALSKARAASAEHCWRLMREGVTEVLSESRDYAVQHGVRHLIDAGRLDDGAEILFDLELLDLHRELAGNAVILGELRALLGKSGRRPVERLFHVWNDESFAIRDTPSLLSQLSYRLKADPELATELLPSFERLANRASGLWLRCRNSVPRRSSGSLVLRGHEGSVNHCVLSRNGRLLVSASWDETLRVWDLSSPEHEPLVLHGHKGAVTHCALSGDGRRLVSASVDGTLRVWDLEALEDEPLVLRDHEGPVTHCVLGQDGRRLVSASDDRTLRVWDLSSPENEPLVLRGHERAVNYCMLSEDGRRLVSASDDWTLRVWNLSSPEHEPMVLHGHERVVTHCMLSGDGRQLVSASRDETLRVWDLSSPEHEPLVLRGHKRAVNHCVLSGDGRRVVSASEDGTLRVWDLSSPEDDPHEDRGHNGALKHCVLSSDDRRLVSASFDKTLRVWDLEEPEDEPLVLRGHESPVTHCLLSRDGRRVVSASRDETLRVWDLSSPEHEPLALRGHEGGVKHCELSGDGRRGVSASDDKTLRVWDPSSPDNEPLVLRGHEASVNHCVLSGDGRQLVSASDDWTLRVWDLSSPEDEPLVLPGHEGGVSHCVLSGDGRRLVSASNDETLRVWDLASPEHEPLVLRGHRDFVTHCALSRDGRRLVSASDDETLRVWDLEEPEGEPLVLRGHGDWVTHSVLSGDGRRLVSASLDETLRVWDLEEPEGEPLVLCGHEGGVRHCALSIDGRRVVSASEDGTLRVWNLSSPESEPLVLRGHEGWVLRCVLSRDGRRVVSASADGTLRVWDLDSASELTRFRAVSSVTWVGWANDDRWVVAADSSGRVWMFELVE